MKIFICEESIDGIFTGIYQGWSSKLGHQNIKIKEKWKDNSFDNFELFAEYITVVTDYELSMKVAKSIKTKLSMEVYDMVCRVALSYYEGKADLIYRFLILGFAVGKDIINHLSNDIVCNMMKISRFVGGEAHNLLGFIRFSEQENGVLISVIHPKNHVLSIITPHFADRLTNEKFIIYDGNRNMASIYIPGRSWILMEVPEYDRKVIMETTQAKDEYADLWKIFFKSIAIKERTNTKLQNNMLPKRYRNDMTEFQDNLKESSNLN